MGDGGWFNLEDHSCLFQNLSSVCSTWGNVNFMISKGRVHFSPKEIFMHYCSLENTYGMICSATEDDVVIFSSGFAFHLKILHERGLSLLKRESKFFSCVMD